MSERKVLNKYFPPDFDPSKIPRRRLDRNQQHTVRLMTPFSMRCDTCGEYIYKRKKFNARKERVEGENYLGIQIFRFYIKCPRCSGEITFKTDPQNSDYVAEHGAQRNFEPWRDEKFVEDELALSKASEEENNPMKALENRTVDSKREMDILDALDEIRTINARHERVDPAKVLEKMMGDEEKLMEARKRREEKEDDALAKAIFKSADGDLVRRILDDDEDYEDEDVTEDIATGGAAGVGSSVKKPSASIPSSSSSSLLATAKEDPFLQPPGATSVASSSKSAGITVASAAVSVSGVKRKNTFDALGIVVKKKTPAAPSSTASSSSSSKPTTATTATIKPTQPAPQSQQPPKSHSNPTALLGLGAYGDSDEDSD
ncbi:hypothetical protein HK102_003519 [Quaeritorhiza haematococci]|nr:hypothetical protein HK102_003519 [Quaeritorhiza haematococci]